MGFGKATFSNYHFHRHSVFVVVVVLAAYFGLEGLRRGIDLGLNWKGVYILLTMIWKFLEMRMY